MFQTKRILSLMLILAMCLTGIVSEAKNKPMFVKKTTTMKTHSGKVIVPQYHKVKVKMQKNPIATFASKPIASMDDLKVYYTWFLPKKTNVIIDNKKGKLKIEKLTAKKPKFDMKHLPYNTFKCYMSYRAITASGSPQYRLQHTEAYTDFKTGVRMVDGRYCIAVGPKVATKIGTKLELVFKGGKKVPAIVADQKAGTIDGYRHPDGSAVEFVVDMGYLPRVARLMGDMSVLDKFKGRITRIKVFKKRRKGKRNAKN